MSKRWMMKSLCLALVLVFALMGTAFAGFCMECGTSLPDGANFCYSCGAKQGASGSTSTKTNSGTLKITDVDENDDGSVTMRWTDSGSNAPYTIHYSFVEEAPNYFYWYNESNVRNFTFEWLVPGVDYLFTVIDSEGNEAEYQYNAPSPYSRNEIGIKLNVSAKRKMGSDIEDVLRFQASEIRNRKSTQSYGLRINMEYSRLAKPRNFRYRFCLQAPNGYAEAIWGGTIDLPAGRSRLDPWTFIPLDDYFDTLMKYYEEIPIGEHILTFYYDDALVLSETIYVGN